MTTKTIYAMFVTAALAAAGCGGGATNTTTSGDETNTTATTTGGETTGGETTAADAGTGEATPPTGGSGADWATKVAAGQDRFDHVCGTCHPGGEGDTGPDLHNKHWTVERVTNQIRNGSGHMRPIPVARLSDEDLPNVLAWLSTIGTVDGLQH